MQKFISLCLIASLFLVANVRPSGAQTQPAPAPAAVINSGLTLTEDTPVRLRLSQTLSSGTSHINDKVDFDVIEDVKIGDVVVIPQGSTAFATVTVAQPKRSFGRAGKLLVNVDYVRLGNGDKAPLRSVKGGSGGSHTAAMTGAVVATAIVFFPAAPLFFFIKGKNIIIPKGTEVTAYVAADTPVVAPVLSESSTAAPTVSPTVSDASTVVVRSTPDGAEITIDGKFVGTTPSTLVLTPGEHAISVVKIGHQEWARTATLTAGSSISIDATLVPKP